MARLAVRDFGIAIKFWTTSDNVDLPNIGITLNQPITVSFWFKTAVHNAYQILFNSYNGVGNQLAWGIRDTTNRLEGAYYSGSGYSGGFKTNTIFVPAQWYHFVYTYDGTNVNVYTNGVSDYGGSSNIGGSGAPSVNRVTVGNRADHGISVNFNGIMDDVRVFNRALTANEISALYYSGTLPADKSTSLIAEYLFNEGSGATAFDSSGNGNNGTITGAAYTTDVPMQARTAVPLTGTFRAMRQLVGGNMIFNGDFEYAPPYAASGSTGARWIDGTATGSTTNDAYRWLQQIDATAGTVSFDGAIARAGSSASVKCDVTNATGRTNAVYGSSTGTGSSLARTNLLAYGIKVEPSTSYTLSYWIKGSTLVSGGVDLQQHGPDGTRITTSTVGGSTVGTVDWTFKTGTLVTNAGTAFIVLAAGIKTAGQAQTAWFDDITLTPTINTSRALATGRTIA